MVVSVAVGALSGMHWRPARTCWRHQAGQQQGRQHSCSSLRLSCICSTQECSERVVWHWLSLILL